MNVLTKVIQGKTIHYTRMGLGLAALGRPGYMTLGHGDDLPAERTKEAMLHHAITVLDVAWAAGMRYYDVARSYGLSELYLQTWLRIRGISPEQVTVASKWGYTYTADWQVNAAQHEVKDHGLAALRRQIGESSSLIGSWLKLYQIHSATLESGVLERIEVLDELARLRDGGLLIGLSVSGNQQSAVIEKALTIRRGEQLLFGSVQATWNLLERSAGAALEAAHQAGWLVIVKEGLANGRLASRGLSTSSALFKICEQSGLAADTLALSAILKKPWVDVLLSGASTPSQLLSNLRAETVDWRSEWETATHAMSEAAVDYWQERAQLKWN